VIQKPLPLILYPARPRPLKVIQVGAGGTGARIAIALVKMLESRDVYHILDHDIVERKNIYRQHFCEADIGLPKAEVLARRLMVGAASTVTIRNHRTKWSDQWMEDLLWNQQGEAHPEAYILIGAVDNVAARHLMKQFTTSEAFDNIPWLYVDTGNEMTGGQVTMDCSWYFHKDPQIRDNPVRMLIRGSDHFPRLYDLENTTSAPNAAPGCALRADTQTVAANNMAAALAINIISWFLDQQPVSNAGSYFSTTGSSRTLMLSEGSNGRPVVNR
jgi:molybdopterin/thiamine biosynthesis adenylyltransferase